MTRFGVTVAAVMLLAVACSSSPGPHWRRSTGAQTLVVFQPSGGLSAANRDAMAVAAGRWSQAGRLEVRVRACRTGENCVPWYGGRMNGGAASIGAGGGHIFTGTGTWVKIDNSPGQVWANMVNLACHEAGHALGLGHGDDPGPCQAGKPTAWDLYLIDDSYNHRDNTGPPGV